METGNLSSKTSSKYIRSGTPEQFVFEARIHENSTPDIIYSDSSETSSNKLAKTSPVVNRSIENCIVVWLSDTTEKQKVDQELKTNLLKVINIIRVFENISTALTYIHNINDETIFLIISGKSAEEILAATRNLAQVDSIYLLNMSIKLSAEWRKNLYKVKGVFTEITNLIKQLRTDIRQCEHNLVGSIYIKNSTSSTTNNKQNSSVMYTQLFRDILLRMKDNNLNEMFEYCRTQYQYYENEFIFKEISAIEQQYKEKLPITWYTMETFLYRMLNKALRIQDIDTIYALRTYIRHIHEQIAQLYSKSNLRCNITLYRGQQMKNNEFEELKKNQGGLLFFDNFLSCSDNLDVAKVFANGNANDPTKTRVIFVIEINRLVKNNVKFANIHRISAHKEEKEWLFSVGSIFRIGWLMKLNNDGIWYINLHLTHERDLELTSLTQYMRNFIKSQNLLIELGKLMWEMGKYEQTEKLYLEALKAEHEWQRRSGILNRLGMICWKKNDLEKAHDFYQQALEIDQQHMSENDPSFSSIYINLGLIYLNQGKLDLAEQHFQHAYQLDLASKYPKKEWLSTYYNNMASVLAAQEKYEEALSYHEHSLKTRLEHLPSVHPLIALSHNNIAIILMRLNRLSEAYEHSQKAVNIASQSLLTTHPDTKLYKENLDLISESIQQMNSL